MIGGILWKPKKTDRLRFPRNEVTRSFLRWQSHGEENLFGVGWRSGL